MQLIDRNMLLSDDISTKWNHFCNFRQMKQWSRILYHFLFWLLSALFLMWFYTKLTREYAHTIVLAGIVWFVSMAVVYFFIRVLIPIYLITRRLVRFWILTCYTVVLAVWLSLFSVILYFAWLMMQTNGQTFPFNIDLVFLLAGQFLVIAAGVLLHSVRENIRMKNNQLRLLKSQFHPHFLFNTLNNLYALSLKKSDETPRMILKLSDLLDYSLHKSDQSRVTVEEEVQLIENYFDLARMRFGDSLNLTLVTELPNAEFRIPPMLLLPFVENAIKHGVHPDIADNKVVVSISGHQHRIHFRVWNKTCGAVRDGRPGLGIQQVKERLDLLLPGRFKLEIKDASGEFQVSLILYE